MMRFGWLTLAHSPSADQDGLAIDQQLTQSCFAETMGFDDIWLTEHNFTGESVYNDPIPFAGALAVQTSRVRIGFAVIQMALRHPIRLAVQLSLLDNLSKGRLDIGVGRGSIYNEYEFVGYGLRSDDSRARMAESLEILTRAWTEEPFEYHGSYYDLKLPSIRPRPFQKPHPPIWRSAISPASVTDCGRRGDPVMTARVPLQRIAGFLSQYQEGLEAGGHPAATRQKLLQDAAVWRMVYVADSNTQAEEELGAALLHTRHHMQLMRKIYNPDDFQIDPAMLNTWADPNIPDEEGLQYILQTGSVYGSPKRVKEQIAELRATGLGHLLCQMSFGGMSHDKVMASMQRFGEHVIPCFTSHD